MGKFFYMHVSLYMGMEIFFLDCQGFTYCWFSSFVKIKPLKKPSPQQVYSLELWLIVKMDSGNLILDQFEPMKIVLIPLTKITKKNVTSQSQLHKIVAANTESTYHCCISLWTETLDLITMHMYSRGKVIGRVSLSVDKKYILNSWICGCWKAMPTLMIVNQQRQATELSTASNPFFVYSGTP